MSDSGQLPINSGGPSAAISVIIPCYNQGRFLLEAIDSALASDFQDFEIIVVNDGSTDSETKDILAHLNKPKTTIINQENRGLATARNVGIRASQSRYFLALDADDTIEPSYLGQAYRLMEANPELGYAYSYAHLFGDVDYVYRPPQFNFFVLLWENIVHVCALVRKTAWIEVGGYNRNMIYGYEDWDFWVNLGKHGWFGLLIPEPLANYRKHGATMQETVIRRKKLMVEQMRKNHPEIYADGCRLREIRRKWMAGHKRLYLFLLAKRIWWSDLFPNAWRHILRPTINRHRPSSFTN